MYHPHYFAEHILPHNSIFLNELLFMMVRKLEALLLSFLKRFLKDTRGEKCAEKFVMDAGHIVYFETQMQSTLTIQKKDDGKWK